MELEEGVGEDKVERYMHDKVFDVGYTPTVKRSDKKRMFQRHVPNDNQTPLQVSIPTPDSAFGYNRSKAFPDNIQLINMGNDMVANGDDLLYPFLAVEFKSDGPYKSSNL